MGGCFLSLGLFISSLTKNQIVAAMATFAVFLMLWVINWIGASSARRRRRCCRHLSITEHFDDFAKGIIDTQASGLLRQLHRVRAVPHHEVGGQRTVAGLDHGESKITRHHRMDRHGAGVWRRGGALLPAGVEPVRHLRGVGRPGLRARSTWRASGATSPTSTRAAAPATARCRSSASWCSSASWWRSTTSASRQSKRWDFTANQIYSLSDQTVKILKELDSPVKFTVFDQE